jgi:hypothetical protein
LGGPLFFVGLSDKRGVDVTLYQLNPINQPEKTLNNENLACPARFERATYALEALKMS